MSRREKRRLSKAEREARRRKRDAQELDDLVRETAAVFRSSFDTGEDSATECNRRCEDLEADLNYRRLAHEIWRGRPGAEALSAAMADLLIENERHLIAMTDLRRRFVDLGHPAAIDVILDAVDIPDDLIRTMLFAGQ